MEGGKEGGRERKREREREREGGRERGKGDARLSFPAKGLLKVYFVSDHYVNQGDY